MNTHDWTEDAGHENGNYLHRCITCGSEFTGHKRRVTCRVCATTTEADPHGIQAACDAMGKASRDGVISGETAELKVWCAMCGKMTDHQSGSCPQIKLLDAQDIEMGHVFDGAIASQVAGETPRTDAHYLKRVRWALDNPSGSTEENIERAISEPDSWQDFARALERELAAAIEEKAKVENELRYKPRVERCCECQVLVSEWVEAEHRNGRICRPCEWRISLQADLAAAQQKIAELEAARQKNFKSCSDALKQLTAARAEMLQWRIVAQEMTPGGSEYMDRDAVLRYYREFKEGAHKAKLDFYKQQADLTAARAEVEIAMRERDTHKECRNANADARDAALNQRDQARAEVEQSESARDLLRLQAQALNAELERVTRERDALIPLAYETRPGMAIGPVTWQECHQQALKRLYAEQDKSAAITAERDQLRAELATLRENKSQ